MGPVTITPEPLNPLLGRLPAPILLHVRREERWREAADTIPGAVRRDPEAVATRGRCARSTPFGGRGLPRWP
jgi:hypothetical protein